MQDKTVNDEQRPPLNAGAPVILAISTIALVGVGLGLFSALTPRVNLITFQVAGLPSVAARVVGGRANHFGTAIHWDYVLLGCVTAALVIACYLGSRSSLTSLARRLSIVGVCLGFAFGFTNLAQDLLLLDELPKPGGHSPALFRVVQALSFAKFSALLAAALIGFAAWWAVVGRLAHSRWDHPKAPGVEDLIPPRPRESPTEAELRAEKGPYSQNRESNPSSSDTLWQDLRLVPPGRGPAEIGVCVSGGGVRSATVTLGALQALREGGELQNAKYLVSVSGGGYMAGAFQLLLSPDDQGVDGLQTVTALEAYVPGSPEEDHTRRHSSYLSDGLGQWIVALGVLLRNLVVSVVLISLTIAAAGLFLALFYHVTQITDLHLLQPRFLHPAADKVPGFPVPSVGITAVVIAIATLTAVAWLVELVWTTSTGSGNRSAGGFAKWLLSVTVLVVMVGVVLPAAVWISAWVTWHVGHATPGTVATVGTVTGILSYMGTVIAVLWRNKKTITTVASGAGGLSKGAVGQVLPNSMIQMILMWISLLALLMLFVLVAGWVASSGAERSWFSLVPVAVLAGAWLLLDQTWMSLHPFYRRRLASAFAVHRVMRHGRLLATAYDDSHPTPLTPFAKKANDFPKVIFATTANITGQERTPPGRRAVAYTLADDYIGGPQVGWLSTSYALGSVSEHIKRDLTVEAAVAISGAAFASAMGAMARFYEVFLALSNARLGAWLPNPYFMWIKESSRWKKEPNRWTCEPGNGDWTIPAVPRIRRLSYFGREIFGIHSVTNPLLLCTDGGHYDNLGLVELLRHGCRLIYCIDASGDSPPMATTLAQAITIAREELGVQIVMHDELDLVPGTASPLEPVDAFAQLNPRLSKSLVCTGTITYPRNVAYGDQITNEGTLIFAKAGLTHDLPYELLAYAVNNRVFPRDSTSDQWFNWGQFDAYLQLGREMGKCAIAANS